MTTPPAVTAEALAGALALIDAMKPRDESREGAPRMTAPALPARPPARHGGGGGGGADATSRRSDMLTRIFDAGPSGVSFRHLTDAKPGSREYLRAYNDLQVLKWVSCVKCVGISRERGRPYLWAVVTRERPDVEQS